MASSRRSSSLLLLALIHAGCQQSQVTEPSAALREGISAPASAAQAQALPQAVFSTRPADEDGIISGPGPLEVQFNLCRSRPSEPGDELKFTYDFDGDGDVDEMGHCRARHTFEVAATVRVCVSDRRPDGAVCRTYKVDPTPEPDRRPLHVMALSLNGCGAGGSRYLYLNTTITPPIPAGQPYSVTMTIDGELGSAPYLETVASISDFDCDDHSRSSDSSFPPTTHLVTMAAPRCPHARPFLFAALEGSPPIADRLVVSVDRFDVPGRRTRIQGRTTWICP